MGAIHMVNVQAGHALDDQNKIPHTGEHMPTKSVTPAAKPTHEEIAERARALYEKSGRQAGHDVENWLAAEAQLQAERHMSTDPRTATRALVRTTPVVARS